MRKASFERNTQTSHANSRYILSERKKSHTKWTSFLEIFSLRGFSLGWILKFSIALGVIGLIVGGGFLFLLIRDIPSIESIEKGDYFQENTTIYDKKGNPIYTLFNDGKRTYIPYSEIPQSIKDAIVSVEDKTFFENPGVDLKGLVRAGYNYVTGKTTRIQGTSTLSQQLISYTLLSKERSIKRKIREAYLSYELNNNYPKEKILEMYLNAISFGNNANGVEEAAKTYFGKSAKDVGPLGASILASLPKGPSYYSPYSQRARLMGDVIVYPLSDPEDKTSISAGENKKKYDRMYGIFRSYLSGITIEPKESDLHICNINKEYVRTSDYLPSGDGCIDITHDELLSFIGDIAIRDSIVESGSTMEYVLEYTIGRKDFVAARMFEDGKIDGSVFKKIIYDGLEFRFEKYSENIRYPYFVMYIKEYLEAKYGKDIDITQGLKVYTTLDPDLQDKAESLVRRQATTNKTQYGARSAALVSMDNKNGALLAMVGGPDYFDTENGGNNNMITARRQPGSSFKPIVYALSISKNPIGPLSPVADVKTSFGSWKPENYDGKYKGVMTLEKALAYSRNIPAIKMYYLAGQEEAIAKHAQSIGLDTIKTDGGVGGALALGAGEVQPIDLMQAYSVFSNMGVRRDLYTIEKIVDHEGNIIEEHTKIEKEEPIFSPPASYILTQMLANVEARPEGKWREYITIGGNRRAAVKTGTSDKKVGKLPSGDDKLLPRDLWTAGYTPQITTVVWAGNVDGKETYGSCDGLNCAAPIWRQYMEYAHKNLPKEDWKKPEGVQEVSIVKSSGLLATDSTPSDQIVTTIMAMKPTESDSGFKSIKVDTLCNGPVSENTPEGSLGYVLVPNGKPVIDGFKEEWLSAFRSSIGAGKTNSAPCERPGGPGDVDIGLSLVGVNAGGDSARKTLEGTWSSDRKIRSWSFLIDGETKISQPVEDKLSGAGRTSIINDSKEHIATFQVIDIYGFAYRESRVLQGGELGQSVREKIPTVSPPSTTGSISPPLESPIGSPEFTGNTEIQAANPQILISNPRGGSISIYKGDPFNLRFSINVVPGAREVNVTLAGNVIKSATSGESFVVGVSSESLEVGSYPITLSVIDSNLKTISKTINLTILRR